MTNQTPLEVPESWLEESKYWGIWHDPGNGWCFTGSAPDPDYTCVWLDKRTRRVVVGTRVSQGSLLQR